MGIYFNNGSGLEDLKECVVDINGEIKNVVSIYGKENDIIKRIWGIGGGHEVSRRILIMKYSGNRTYQVCYCEGSILGEIQYPNIISNSNLGQDYCIKSLIYCDGRYYMMSDNYEWLYSFDGITWVNTGMISEMDYIGGVTYGNGKIILSGVKGLDNPTKTIETYDINKNELINTFNVDTTLEIGFAQVQYGNNMYIILAYKKYYYSYDGVIWTQSSDGKTWDYAFGEIAYGTMTNGNKVFIASGILNASDSSNRKPCVVYSTNGLSWNPITTFTGTVTSNAFKIIYGKNTFTLSSGYYNGLRYDYRLNSNFTLTRMLNPASNTTESSAIYGYDEKEDIFYLSTIGYIYYISSNDLINNSNPEWNKGEFINVQMSGGIWN